MNWSRLLAPDPVLYPETFRVSPAGKRALHALAKERWPNARKAAVKMEGVTPAMIAQMDKDFGYRP